MHALHACMRLSLPDVDTSTRDLLHVWVAEETPYLHNICTSTRAKTCTLAGDCTWVKIFLYALAHMHSLTAKGMVGDTSVQAQVPSHVGTWEHRACSAHPYKSLGRGTAEMCGERERERENSERRPGNPTLASLFGFGFWDPPPPPPPQWLFFHPLSSLA